METFQFVQLPNSNTVNDSTAAGTAVSKEEVEQLRRKVTLLESKLEELQDTVRVQGIWAMGLIIDVAKTYGSTTTGSARRLGYRENDLSL